MPPRGAQHEIEQEGARYWQAVHPVNPARRGPEGAGIYGCDQEIEQGNHQEPGKPDPHDFPDSEQNALESWTTTRGHADLPFLKALLNTRLTQDLQPSCRHGHIRRPSMRKRG